MAGPAVLVGDGGALRSALGWRPEHDWRQMVRDAVAWRRSMPEDPGLTPSG